MAPTTQTPRTPDELATRTELSTRAVTDAALAAGPEAGMRRLHVLEVALATLETLLHRAPGHHDTTRHARRVAFYRAELARCAEAVAA